MNNEQELHPQIGMDCPLMGEGGGHPWTFIEKAVRKISIATGYGPSLMEECIS